MAVADIFQLTVDGKCHGQRIMNVLHYRQSVGVTNPEQELLNRFIENTELAWKQAHATEYTISGYICQKIFPNPITTLVTVDRANEPGTVEGAPLPTSAPVVLSKITALAGRANRGRLYLSGVPSTFENDSVVVAPGIAAYLSLATNLGNSLVTVGGGTFDPVLWHRATSGYTPITRFQLRLPIRSQRRRQVGRGE